MLATQHASADVGQRNRKPITDALRASYVIVRGDRHGHHVEDRQVDYDRDRFLRTLAESGHPASNYIASFQRGEQVRYQTQRPGAPETTDSPRALDSASHAGTLGITDQRSRRPGPLEQIAAPSAAEAEW